MRIVEIAVLYVAAAVGTEDPILVRGVDVVEEAVGKHAGIVERDGVVPTGNDKAGTGNTLFEKVLFPAVFKHIPLGAVNGRLDVIAVLRLTGANALQRVVAVFGDLPARLLRLLGGRTRPPAVRLAPLLLRQGA